MHIIQNNPYRIVGLLVGAKAREQERQIRRLKQFIEADQEPEDDFSFPELGRRIHRTLENVSDASSKLNLDSDKMNAALFWFYKGNPITDEPAFDAIKEGDLDQALSIWSKLTASAEVTQRNASAFSNLSTLYLSGVSQTGTSNEDALEQGILLKLKFLESDFVKDIKAAATDETFKATKSELQLAFLNQLQAELEKSGLLTSNQLIGLLAQQTFSAKEDFLKGFVQKPIEQTEKKIEESRSKRKANPANAVNIGSALFVQTAEDLRQLKSALGTANLKFSSISDKVSDEILQCGIDYFLHYKETNTDPGSATMDLFRKAKTLAIGNIAKQRCQENTENLEEWINDKPERDRYRLVSEELKFVAAQLKAFQNLSDTVVNAQKLLVNCKPKLMAVKQAFGANDEFYLNLSSSVVQNVQNMLVQAVNTEVEAMPNNPIVRLTGIVPSSVREPIATALDVTFNLATLDMHSVVKDHFYKNLKGILSLAVQLNISTLTPKETLQVELKKAEENLKLIRETTFFKPELSNAEAEMNKIKGWHFLRNPRDREMQINTQQQKIDTILKRSEAEKKSQTSKQQNVISKIKEKIQNSEY